MKNQRRPLQLAKTDGMVEGVVPMQEQLRQPAEGPGEQIRTLLIERRLQEAHQIVMGLLDQRVAAGDVELHAVSLLAQYYQVVLTAQPPLSHHGTVPLRPNDRLYDCFDQFVALIRRQESQLAELHSIVAELI